MCRTGEVMVVGFEWWSWLEMEPQELGVCSSNLLFGGITPFSLMSPLLPPRSMWFVLWDWLHTYRVWLLTVK